MKKFVSFLAILAIILFSYCSKIEPNNDPIVGIWVEAISETDVTTAKNNTRVEWIFNDVYLGRYHEINQGQVILKTDFAWSQKDGVYTIEYRGLENKPNDIVIIKTTTNGSQLQQTNGNALAIKE